MSVLGLLLVLALAGVTRASHGNVSVNILKSRDLLRAGNHTVEADESFQATAKYNFLLAVSKDNYLSIGVSEDVVGLLPFHLSIVNTATGEKVHLLHSFSGPLQIRQKFALVRNVQTVDMLPDTMRVEVRFSDVTETSFFHTIVDPWTVRPGVYELFPEHRGLGVRFTLNFTDTTVYWKVQRRPPIPDFVARVTDANGVVVTEGVASSVPPTGVTFDNVFDLSRPASTEFNWSSCTLVVIFVEPLTEYRGHYAFENAKETLSAALGKNNDFLDVTLNDKGGMKLRLETVGSDVSLLVLQPFPVEDLTVLMRLNNELLFAESEAHVPFIDVKSTETQFGWLRVFNTNFSGMQPDDRLEFVALYNRERHEGLRERERDLHHLLRFVRRYGGNVDNLRPAVYSRSPATFATLVPLDAGDVVFSVPYSTILQHDVCDKVPVLKTFFESESFNSVVSSSQRIDAELVRSVMSITLCSIVVPNSPIDGTNWRPMFRSYMADSPNLPMFWPKAVLHALFSWSPVVEEVRLQLEQWTDEHDMWVEAMEGSVSRNITLQEYFAARGHVLGKLLNLSGRLSLVPIHSILQHDDDPNVAMQIDDEGATLLFTATRPIAKGTPLLINKGSAEKLKAEFLIHHGTVPLAAVSSAVVRNVTLTPDKRTRRPLLDGRGEDAALAALAAEITKAAALLPSEIPPVQGEEAKHAMAVRLLEAEKAVLKLHEQYAQEDIAALSSRSEEDL